MAAGRAEFFPPVRLSGQGRLRGVSPRFMVQPPRALAWERAALGRRQVVRQWILIPPCGGSNPPAPANYIKQLVAMSFSENCPCRHLVGTGEFSEFENEKGQSSSPNIKIVWILETTLQTSDRLPMPVLMYKPVS